MQKTSAKVPAAPTPAAVTDPSPRTVGTAVPDLSSAPIVGPGPWRTALRWLGVVAMLYLLISAIGIIGNGFKGLGADTARGLFDFATNPLVGLFVGVLATALIQSSSTTTALVVTAVGAGAMPVSVAIPMVMGANIGTSVTSTLAALGFVGRKDEFERGFAAASVHDFFNLIAVAILLPLEIVFHPLEKASAALTGILQGTVLPDPDKADVIGMITGPVTDVVGMSGLAGLLGGGTVSAVATVAVGIALIFVAMRYLGKLLQVLMVGKAKSVLERTVGGRPLVAMGAGAGVTAIVQSSSVTTSMMVPFAAAGTLTTRQIYPLTLGANVGTTITAMLAALAVTGADASLALQIALVHVLFNLFGIVIIYGLPFLRMLPVRAAEKLAAIAVDHKSIVAAWVVSVFLVIPAAGIAISTLL